DMSSTSHKYLEDLERALSEFKSLSEAYTDTAVEQRKGQAKASEAKNNKEDESQSEEESTSASEDEQEQNKKNAADDDDAHSLEPMESEDLDNLTVPEGEGEIIDLNASPSSTNASAVRKRH
uniref:Uncharacterized protein n=1 Tax=Plectus sambesii TaxID=2011161 RepID=A0A914X477_9BILA